MPKYLFKLTQKKPQEMVIKAPNLRIARILVLDKFMDTTLDDDDYKIELKLVSQKKLNDE